MHQAQPGTAVRPAWSDSLRLIAPLAVYRVGFLILLNFSLMLMPMSFHRVSGFVNANGVSFLEACSTWDAGNYFLVAERGYRPGDGTANFFPLWPALIHVAVGVGFDQVVGALVLSNLLALGATILLHRLACLRFGLDSADAAILLFLAYPSAFFLSMPYSESLFLVLAIGLFLAMEHDNLIWMCVAGFLIVFARPVGFCCIVPLVADQLLKRRRIIAVALPPLIALAIYFAIMKFFTGDALANVHLQYQTLAQPSALRLLHLLDFLAHFFAGNVEIHGYLNSGIDRCSFVLCLLMLYPIARHRLADFVYSLPLIIVPAVTTSMISFTRYSLVVFPVFLVGGSILSVRGRRQWFWPLLAFSFGLQLLLMIRHTHGYWAG